MFICLSIWPYKDSEHPDFNARVNHFFTTRRSGDLTLRKIAGTKLLITDAERLFFEILSIEEELWGKNSNNYIVTLNNLAYCYSLKGDYEKCRDYSLECIKLAPTHKNYENVLSSSIVLGDSILVSKYLPLTYNASLEHLKKQFLYLGASQREELIEDGKSYGFSNLALPASIYPENEVCTQYAYNSALVYKGLLLSTERDVEATLATIPDEVLKDDYKELKEMRRQLQMISDSMDVASLKRNLELKEKEFIRSFRKHSDFTKNLDIDWKDIQKQLQTGDVAIEFVEIDKSILSPDDTLVNYGAVLLKKEWRAPKFILLYEKQKIDRLISNVITDFKDAESKAYNKEEWEMINQQLFDMIWEPISYFLEPKDCIYFSPVGMLALAPMEVLQDSKGLLMDEKYKLYRMSSTKYLCKVQIPEIKDNAILYGGLKYDEDGNMKSVQAGTTSKREGWHYLPSSAKEIAILDTPTFQIEVQFLESEGEGIPARGRRPLRYTPGTSSPWREFLPPHSPRIALLSGKWGNACLNV